MRPTLSFFLLVMARFLSVLALVRNEIGSNRAPPAVLSRNQKNASPALPRSAALVSSHGSVRIPKNKVSALDDSQSVPNSSTNLRVSSVPSAVMMSLMAPCSTQQQDTALAHKSTTTTTVATTGSSIRYATGHKRWGRDNVHANEYWSDHRIHNLGNCGFNGAFHAALAPLSTKLIDVLAYDGIDIRQKVAFHLAKVVDVVHMPKVVDLCCGVGISTRALKGAFPNAEAVIGVDSSSEMVAMATFLAHHLAFVKGFPLLGASSRDSWQRKLSTTYTLIQEQGNKLRVGARRSLNRALMFIQANAEDTQLPESNFDLVTIMYAFHEAPMAGRARILREAHRLLRPGGTLAVVDIATDYTPSESMLSGEPYVLEYQQNVHRQLNVCKGFSPAKYKCLVPGHVGMWLLKRSPFPV